MIGQKPLGDIRANLLKECAQAGIDPLVWFDQQIQNRERLRSANPIEIETLKLIRDGLQAEKPAAKSLDKRGMLTAGGTMVNWNLDRAREPAKPALAVCHSGK